MKTHTHITVLLIPLLLIACSSGSRRQIKATATAESTPWTTLQPNADPDHFQFVIVADRTGEHRPGIFPQAVHTINLLHPELVISVGDLIEGYSTDPSAIDAQGDEFDSVVDSLDMPFFYVPGNHDVTNLSQTRIWRDRLGPTYYHFIYKNTLFLCLNSESDLENPESDGALSEAQLEYFRQVLRENQHVRWTLQSQLPNNPDFKIEVQNTAGLVKRHACTRRTQPVHMDGDLSEWQDLPIAVDEPGFIQFDR